jgi:hypothetical protein
MLVLVAPCVPFVCSFSDVSMVLLVCRSLKRRRRRVPLLLLPTFRRLAVLRRGGRTLITQLGWMWRRMRDLQIDPPLKCEGFID